AAAAAPIRHIHVSDRGRFGFAHIDAAEQRVEALGYAVINRVLGDVLQRALPRVAGLEQLCPARTVAVRMAASHAEVSVDAGDGARTLTTRLLVAADGASSAVRDMLGIGAQRTDYAQTAVIGNLRTERSLDDCAYERFTPDGPLALLPITEGRAAFIWTLAPARARQVSELTDDEFIAALQDAFGLRLGRFARVGVRASYALALTRAHALVARRGVVIGNAAHGLHPVAAQGFNLGLRDVAALGECIADARHDGTTDAGDAVLLERYADWRRSDQRNLVHFTDGLVRLFGSRRRSLRVLRDAGMLGFDLIPGIRGLLARHTMGLAGRLPRLSRGVPLA
ncbi:MAG TPA: FAD-dependent monooxygenase, partial [Woeseiaceae bacterium]|nr:FAD-dependent monooxygenase [Woeseiaceae bacterium]